MTGDHWCESLIGSCGWKGYHRDCLHCQQNRYWDWVWCWQSPARGCKDAQLISEVGCCYLRGLASGTGLTRDCVWGGGGGGGVSIGRTLGIIRRYNRWNLADKSMVYISEWHYLFVHLSKLSLDHFKMLAQAGASIGYISQLGPYFVSTTFDQAFLC